MKTVLEQQQCLVTKELLVISCPKRRGFHISKNPPLRQVEIVKHEINLGNAKPIKQQPYRVPFAEKCLIDEEVEQLLVKEIIRPSASP